MARWKARVEFLLSIIELLFLSLTVEALQGKMCQNSLPSGLGQFEPRPTLPSYQVASWSMQPFGHNRHGPKIGELCPLLVELVRIKHNVARAEAYLHTKWHLDPSSRLATTDIGRKLGAVPPFWRKGELGPHLAQCGMGQGLPPYQVAFWSIQPFGHNRHGSKIFFVEGAVPIARYGS